MTAAINSLLVICQHRAEYIDFTVKTLMEWRVSPPEHLKPHQVKSVERTIKIFMLCMLRYISLNYSSLIEISFQ